MPALVVVCKNENCRRGIQQCPDDPQAMVCTGETFSAWTFVCPACRGMRVCTKDQIGGTFGSGRRDDGTGPTTAKGPSKYREGASFR